MKMVVGLGNPGKEYEQTKHNIGFMVIDRIAQQEGVQFNKKRFGADYGEFFCNGEKVLLVKPQTFMNDSGRAVGPLMAYFDLEMTDLTVIYDDMDLPVGKIRLRQKGSAGGHNGIKSLLAHLETPDFNRIRVGIGRPLPGQTVIKHVLSNFPKTEQVIIDEVVEIGTEAVLYWCANHTFLETMNIYNSKQM